MHETSAKSKIEQLVNAYITRYPDEFSVFKEAMEMKKSATRDEYAKVEGSDQRGLFECPEKLYGSFTLGLDDDEMEWFKSIEGARWFAKHFSTFALPLFI